MSYKNPNLWRKIMFDDGRSKKVVFIAHCFLNQNSISDGTAVYPAMFRNVIELFMKADIGIAQMPCPELCCLGLDRGNIYGVDVPVVVENPRIRAEMKKDIPNAQLDQLSFYQLLNSNQLQIVYESIVHHWLINHHKLNHKNHQTNCNNDRNDYVLKPLH